MKLLTCQILFSQGWEYAFLMGVPCFLLFDPCWIWEILSLLGFLLHFLTPNFAPSPPRVKSGTAALLSRFSQECSISYPIFSIDILANTMCREFLACFFVTNLNIGIKHHLYFYYLTALYMTSYKPKLSLKLFYLILLPQGCTKKLF